MERKEIFAGFQVPQFDPLVGNSGGSGSSSFTVSGGYVGLGFGYGDNWVFALTVGWPYSSYLDPDIGNPDWSRAVTVHWDGAFPLNTFAGGVSLYLSQDRQAFGLALRAGWTWKGKAEAWKLTAEAELGIMVGGVLHFLIGANQYVPAPGTIAHGIANSRGLPALEQWALRPSREKRIEFELASMFLALIDEAFGDLAQQSDIGIKCGLFMDAWGAARVKFFGITLVGVRIDAHAQVIIKYSGGKITDAYADAKFSVSVKIGCTTYRTSAHFRIDYVKSDARSYLTAWQLAGPDAPALIPSKLGEAA